MTAIRAVQEVATLDDFLADPLVRAELEAVIERLMSPAPIDFAGGPYHSMRVKVREQWSRDGKTKLGADDVARLIVQAWSEHRP